MNDRQAVKDRHLASVTRRQAFQADAASRIAAMLDFGRSDWPKGAAVPFGWHFALLGAETPRAMLRADGFPGLGIGFPHVPGQRLVAASRKITSWRALHIGQEVERTSRIASVVPKSTPQGPLTVVTVEHIISDTGDNAAMILSEKQTYVLLDTPYVAPQSAPTQSGGYQVMKSITPDDTMLFQFSALGFNSHRIHLDREYARSVEGYPDLVVNGGLTTLLMTELARAHYGEKIKRLTVRNTAPLFVNRPIQLTLGKKEGRHVICALDDHRGLAAEMEFDTDEL